MASILCRPEEVAFVDIFPPINVARVGDSNEHFIGSEVPGVEPVPVGGFKDKDFKIKKQAARFRVYAYDKDNKLLGELKNSDSYSFKWTAHVANKKASWVIFRGRHKPESWNLRNPDVQGWPQGQEKNYEYTNTRTDLIIDSGERIIEGVNAKDVFLDGNFGNDKEIPLQKDVRLGELRTDEHGRLLVLASDGHSYSARGDKDLTSGFDNAGWVDKTCDGTVQVTVTIKSGSQSREVHGRNKATIITAAPRFASGTHCPTTLYELIEDIYARRDSASYPGSVNYYRDIYPLFKRIYLISWTNNFYDMNDYHGIDHMKSYFDNPKLADPSSAKLIRNKVFKRIRAPVIDGNPENEETRDDEADQTFMPALAGDSGDPNPDAPKPDERDRWVSLTQLQYDRLQKWVDGEFTTGNKEDQNPYENVNFDEIPLQDQPSALTRAALEWSVGAPLYPGIEVFWHARQDELYKQAAQNEPWNRFRLADTVTPGDLGKGLALPWQSDFNMCNTHWWPSVRPDLVVAGPNFDSVLGNTQPGDLDKLASNLPPDTRVAWARGIEGEPDSHESNSNMVRKWAELGFVARQYYGPNAQATGNDQYPYGTLGNHRGDVDQNGNPLPEILVERQRNPDAS